MLLIVIASVLTLVGGVGLWLYSMAIDKNEAWAEKHKVIYGVYKKSYEEIWGWMTLLGVGLGIILLAFWFGDCTPTATLQKEIELRETRAGIIYKVAQGLWQDKLDINDTLIVDEITEFNKVILKERAAMKSIVTGAFVNRAYLKVEPIDLRDIETGRKTTD